jgi:hypothetical protein
MSERPPAWLRTRNLDEVIIDGNRLFAHDDLSTETACSLGGENGDGLVNFSTD